ncbi:MAG: alpha/beta hydrolase [Myxococcota bacterium]|nr:alpha/beta hydrolase [Myxococcota bacterium]
MPNPIHSDFQSHPLRPAQKAALLGARAAIGALGAVTRPLRRFRSARIEVNAHRYGHLPQETLEVLEPNPDAPPRAPVVYVHGGGWIMCDKGLYTPELAFLIDHGHRVYNLDYPLAPEHPFPLPLRSLTQALQWVVRREGAETPVHLIGDSAGGNLVMMLALLGSSPSHFEAVDPALCQTQRPPMASVTSLYGVLDRISWVTNGFPMARLMLHCYGGPGATAEEVGPELSLTPCDLPPVLKVPCLLATGTADPLAESSQIARDHLTQNGAAIEYIEYPGEQHGFFNRPKRPASQQLRDDIIRFLDQA